MLKNISFECIKELNTNVINVLSRLSRKAMSRDINLLFMRELNTIVTYVNTTVQNNKVRIHKLAVHERIKINCDQCEYQGTSPCSVRRHQMTVHKRFESKL